MTAEKDLHRYGWKIEELVAPGGNVQIRVTRDDFEFIGEPRVTRQEALRDAWLTLAMSDLLVPNEDPELDASAT